MTMEAYTLGRSNTKRYDCNLFKNASPCTNVRGDIVNGQIPQWINGNFLYNSPAGIYDFRNMTSRHWYDGMGVMSSFKINGRNVTFTKKFLNSDAFKDALRSGRIVWPEHGTPAARNNRSHDDFNNECRQTYDYNECHDDSQFNTYGNYNQFNEYRDNNDCRGNNQYNECRGQFNDCRENNQFNECRGRINECKQNNEFDYNMGNAYMRDQYYRNDFGYNKDCDYNFGGGYCNDYGNNRRDYNSRNYGYDSSCRSGFSRDYCQGRSNDYNQDNFSCSQSSMNNCLVTFKKFSDNCNESFYKFGNTVLATNDSGFERIINPSTLETDGLVDMTKFTSIKTAMPLKDYNGDVYNLATSMGSGVNYHFIKFSNQNMRHMRMNDKSAIAASVQKIATIPSRWQNNASYNHSFGMTENYLIMCEQPWTYNTGKLCNMDRNHMSYRDSMEWRSQDSNMFHIVNKRTGQRKNFRYMSSTPFYFRNFVNCYEIGKFIVADMITYENPEIVDQMHLDKLRNNSFNLRCKSKVYRFVLPLDVHGDNVDLCNGQWNGATAFCEREVVTVTPYRIVDYDGVEQPKVNPCYKYKKYNYFYGVSWMQGFDSTDCSSKCITKVDVCSGKTCFWSGNEFSHPSEVAFVPHPDSSCEDDGVLISCISDSRPDQQDYMVFIDAKSMREIARVTFNEKIPFGNHTYFYQCGEGNECFNYRRF